MWASLFWLSPCGTTVWHITAVQLIPSVLSDNWDCFIYNEICLVNPLNTDFDFAEWMSEGVWQSLTLRWIFWKPMDVFVCVCDMSAAYDRWRSSDVSEMSHTSCSSFPPPTPHTHTSATCHCATHLSPPFFLADDITRLYRHTHGSLFKSWYTLYRRAAPVSVGSSLFLQRTICLHPAEAAKEHNVQSEVALRAAPPLCLCNRQCWWCFSLKCVF